MLRDGAFTGEFFKCFEWQTMLCTISVVDHVIGRLIERVSIASIPENGYRGYCRFSPYIESANGHLERQEDSANPEIVTIYSVGRLATEMVCQRHG